MGHSLWGCKELDTTKQLTHTHTHTHKAVERYHQFYNYLCGAWPANTLQKYKYFQPMENMQVFKNMFQMKSVIGSITLIRVIFTYKTNTLFFNT